jgi:asparagine synthase (glutamine-hydrolysing)
MCGIAGLIDYDSGMDPSATIANMVGSIRHRGPDGSGQVVKGNVAIGHARLSIIDHSGGRQPMSTPDGLVHLTYNGEVYNYKKLRSDLKNKGYQFRTESDTEVVLCAYEAWGKRCVERFEGMFAFAVADFRKRELFLARDQFGIKPLLYRLDNGSFAFASEFAALKQLPDWTGEIDLYAIDLYLRYQYIPAPHTAFRKVFKLPAGHRMTVRMGEPHQKIERYWEPDFSHKKHFREDQLITELDNSLRDSVQRHLVSDVEFGALLSGGVDSSLMVGYMAELLNSPVKTFSIGFDDEDLNELKYARQVAQKYKTDHHEEIVSFDALAMLPEIVQHHGEPFGDQSAIPTWCVSRLARQSVPMVISGDGGDELFAGYSTYSHWKNAVDQRRLAPDRSWKRLARPIARRLVPARYSKTENPEDSSERWISCVGRFNKGERENLWRSDYRFLCDLPDSTIACALQSGQNLEGVNRVQRVDMETFLPESILCKVDIASMRYGLEVRPPILDQRVFKLASSINATQLFSSKHAQSPKMPLKQLLAGKMGHQFAFREKQGFGIPLEKWLRGVTQNQNALRERLCHSDTQIDQMFSRQAIEKTILTGNVENVWLLLFLDEWLSQLANSGSTAVT